MGSGLLWAGLGKGIADAGATMGAAWMQQARDDATAKRDTLLEELRQQREVEREDRKEQREEDKQQRDMDIYGKAQESAVAVGQDRRFERFKRDVGQTDATDEELRSAFDSQYDQRSIAVDGEVQAPYMERYSRLKADTLSEIRRMGGSTALQKGAMDDYIATVKAEQELDRSAREERRQDERERHNLAIEGIQSDRVAAILEKASGNGKGSDGLRETMSYIDNRRKALDSDRKDLNRSMQIELKEAIGDKAKAAVKASYDDRLKLIAEEEARLKNDFNTVRDRLGLGSAATSPNGVGPGPVGNNLATGIDGDIDALSREIARVEKAPLNKSYTQVQKDEQLAILKQEMRGLIGKKSSKQPETTTDNKPSGTARPTSMAEFNALPKGSLYVNPKDGKTYRKN